MAVRRALRSAIARAKVELMVGFTSMLGRRPWATFGLGAGLPPALAEHTTQSTTP